MPASNSPTSAKRTIVWKPTSAPCPKPSSASCVPPTATTCAATPRPTAPWGRSTPPENRVVFFGDSITDGWRLNEYFPGKPYVNRGIGGQITGEMLGRMKADVIDLKSAAVLILAGTNDIARGAFLTRP